MSKVPSDNNRRSIFRRRSHNVVMADEKGRIVSVYSPRRTSLVKAFLIIGVVLAVLIGILVYVLSVERNDMNRIRKDTNSDQDMIEIISRQNSLEEESETLSYIRFDHDLFGVFLR